MKKQKDKKQILIAILALMIIVISMLILKWKSSEAFRKAKAGQNKSEQAFEIVNDNMPYFTDDEISAASVTLAYYSDLDSLGRCGPAMASVSRETMPKEERGEIGSVRPSGWRNVKYPGIVDAKPPFLYNRCHLIAFCLTGENANERNLITGTRYMNVEGMLPFEEQILSYLNFNDNHVLYRVTPIFEDNNLVADGVLMEAYSVEDMGAGICFCVYCHNIQPGIEIDYKTGESRIKN